MFQYRFDIPLHSFSSLVTSTIASFLQYLLIITVITLTTVIIMLLNFLAIIAATSCASASPMLLPQQGKRDSTCDARKYTQLIGGIEENMFIQKQELQG